MTAIVDDRTAHADRCPVGPGLTVGKYFWRLIGPTIRASGPPVRVGGGHIVPVQYRNGKCALVQHWAGDGLFSLDTVNEIEFADRRIADAIRHSNCIPQVRKGENPSILYLMVELDEGPFISSFELRLTGLIGPKGTDEIVALYSSSMDEE